MERTMHADLSKSKAFQNLPFHLRKIITEQQLRTAKRAGAVALCSVVVSERNGTVSERLL